VRRGLEALAAAPSDPVLIHDAARPFVSPALAEAALAALAGAEGACPVLPVADTLRRDASGRAGDLVDRAGLVRAQTPQAFRHGAILAAHRAAAGREFTDDVEVARAAGLAVAHSPGEEANVKLTTAQDLAAAEARLTAEAPMEHRTGTGFDVHALAEGDGVVLCGVVIPFSRALSGHSDADVGMHALTDALFGALAEGDIGTWFPPSDPQWKGAPSRIFLEKAAERVAARGGRIVHCDVTLICEAPKIGPHAAAMRAALAEILALPETRVSVKATTTERLGFPGRGEGIAAQAAATIALPVAPDGNT
jgi:2-C-methyl-D-erythritol 4-phosphate cytidylyltransferase/2-C-methyl-D-erythritol 2,4-cyclodiphosphate synthase